jgi:tRNA-dihydrouridine synthase
MAVTMLLAPMAEISHRALRELIALFDGGGAEACDGYWTEMISAGGLLGGEPFESWYLDSGPAPEKLTYQLVGSDAGQLARAAAVLDKTPCAGIDINMGCAAPAITRTGAGVRWMRDAPAAAAMISRVREATSKRLSVKLRTGDSDDYGYLLDFCGALVDAGVNFITLHPRTAGMKFRRTANWEYVRRLSRDLPVPVAGNGDIASVEELAARAAAGDCAAVMVGRLAVRAPWAFAAAKALNAGLPPPRVNAVNVQETALRFLELLARYQPPQFHLTRARRFFGCYCANFFWAEHLKNTLFRCDSLPAMAAALCTYCKETGEEGV